MTDLGKTFWIGAQITAAAILAWWLGMPAAFKLLIVLQVADVVSGCIVANRREEIRSALAWRGIRTKALSWIIVLVILALQLYAVDQVFGTTHIAGMSPAEVAAIGFAMAEALSIIENAQKLGIPIPAFLTRGLAQTHDEVFNEGNNESG